jgi:cytochrome c oxidase assembly protein subunit 11
MPFRLFVWEATIRVSSSSPKKVGFILTAISLAMLGMAYAAVPLYRLICQKTGFGGTPQVAVSASNVTTNRTIKVQFTATVHRDLPWTFFPKQHEITVKLGQNFLVHFVAQNNSQRPIVGMATYNVSPDKAGIYFNKVQCFCFDEQLLQPGESVDMPVLFYVDPDMDKDHNLDGVTTITLSYTFFEYKK